MAHAGPTITADLVVAFAESITQKEREECARICDAFHKQGPNGAGQAADKIRQRGKKCEHKNRECTYESDDGEFERWQCKDCGERWGVEIAQ